MDSEKSGGWTLIELMVSVAIISTIALAMVVMFQLAMKANIYTTNETNLLTNIRKALQGDGPTPGMLFDSLYASSMTATNSATVSLLSPGNVTTTYSLSSTNLQRSTHTASTLATGVTNLDFTYYQFYSTGSIKKTSSPNFAQFMTISFQTTLSKGTTFYTGAFLRNHL